MDFAGDASKTSVIKEAIKSPIPLYSCLDHALDINLVTHIGSYKCRFGSYFTG